MVIKLSRSYVIINPFTPKSDQFQISPAGSPDILHQTVWRTWLFILLLPRWKIALPILTTSLKHFFFKGWENLLFERGSGRVKREAFREGWGGFLSNCKQSLRNTFDALLYVPQELKSNRTIYMGAMWKAASSSWLTFDPNRDHNFVASRSFFSRHQRDRSLFLSSIFCLPSRQVSLESVTHVTSNIYIPNEIVLVRCWCATCVQWKATPSSNVTIVTKADQRKWRHCTEVTLVHVCA